jgi:hypothetical protein
LYRLPVTPLSAQTLEHALQIRIGHDRLRPGDFQRVDGRQAYLGINVENCRIGHTATGFPFQGVDGGRSRRAQTFLGDGVLKAALDDFPDHFLAHLLAVALRDDLHGRFPRAKSRQPCALGDIRQALADLPLNAIFRYLHLDPAFQALGGLNRDLHV